jgi:hypothetical protein
MRFETVEKPASLGFFDRKDIAPRANKVTVSGNEFRNVGISSFAKKPVQASNLSALCRQARRGTRKTTGARTNFFRQAKAHRRSANALCYLM